MHDSGVDAAGCARTPQPQFPAGRRTHERAAHALMRAARGAVFVEFLIAFLPLYVFFLCLIQLSLLFSVRLLTEHAAANAARAAAVVLAEPKGRYPDPPHRLSNRTSKRYKAIHNAALLSLSPLILNGNIADVDVVFPADATPGAPPRGFPLTWAAMSDAAVTKLRVRVEVDAICRIGFANRIACPPRSLQGLLFPTTKVRAEAVYPYQGARYE